MGRLFEHLSELWSHRDHLFNVVKHEQQVTIAQILQQALHEWSALLSRDMQGVGNGGHHLVRIFQRRQRDKGRAIGKVRRESGRHLDGQARFADPARPCEGRQAHILAQQQVVACASSCVRLIKGLRRIGSGANCTEGDVRGSGGCVKWSVSSWARSFATRSCSSADVENV